MPQFSKACLLLVTFWLPTAFPAWAKTYLDQRPQVVVSVYNDADVPAAVLMQAEQQAGRIFDRAGLNATWKNCTPSGDRVAPDALVGEGAQSSPGLEQEGSAGSNQVGLRPAEREGTPAPTRFDLEALDCASFEWPTHLAVRLATHSRRSTNETFGVAFLSAEGTGCYIDVFYEPAMELHASWNVGLADLLGAVIAHEMGHLLLGSNSHAGVGIMRAHWQSEELRRLSRGNLWFTNEQADQMRGKVSAIRRESSDRMAASRRLASEPSSSSGQLEGGFAAGVTAAPDPSFTV